jgi:hypothetical protein
MESALLTLWIDGVGGYGIWDRNSIEIGRSIESQEGLSIQGELASRSIRIERSAEDWMLYPIDSVFKNGERLTLPHLLQHNDRLKLGEQVELLFERGNSWSSTAKLRIISRHRWSETMDGVLLLGQTCLLGPTPQANIQCREWRQNIVLFRKDTEWMIREANVSAATLLANLGQTMNAKAIPLVVGKRLESTDFSMTLL